MAKWINRTLVQAPRNATTSHTISFAPATAGNFLLLVMDASVTFTVPTGWTRQAQALNATELSVYTKTATAGESSFSTTHNGTNYPMVAVVYEFPAGTTWVKSTTATGLAFGAANPAITGLTGTNLLMAAKAFSEYQTAAAVSWTWSAGVTEDTDVNTLNASSTDGYSIGIGYVEDSTATSFTPTATASPTVGTLDEAVTWAVQLPSAVTALSGTGAATALTLTAATGSGSSLVPITTGSGTGATITLSLTLGTGSGTASGLGALPAMTAWKNALASRGATPATALFIGDSLTEGQGSSAKSKRWLDLLLAHIRTSLPTTGVTGGAGYLPSWYAVYTPDSSWTHVNATRTGTHVDVPQNAGDVTDKSLGLRSDEMSAGATLTYTVTGTSMDLWWVQGYGSFTYTIDAGSPVTVSTAGTTGNPGRTAHVSLGAAGSHTVVITATTAVRFSGLMIYNGDESAGIRFVDAAHVGFYTDAYLGTGMQQAWGLVNPDLAVIELGANDYTFTHATSAQVKANLVSQIAQVRAAVSKQVSIVVINLPSMPASGGNAESWTAYRTAITSIGTDDPTVRIITFPTWSTASDGFHPGDTGQSQIEAVMAPELIFPDTGITSPGAAITLGLTVSVGLGTRQATGNALGFTLTAGIGAGTSAFTSAPTNLSGPGAAIALTLLLASGAGLSSIETGGKVWIFNTPVTLITVPIAGRGLVGSLPYGLSLWRIDGVWRTGMAPALEDIAGADRFYSGGRLHVLDDVARAELIDAGFAANITLQENT